MLIVLGRGAHPSWAQNIHQAVHFLKKNTRTVKAMVWWLYPILSPFYPHCSPLGLNLVTLRFFLLPTVSMYFSTQDGKSKDGKILGFSIGR